MGYKRFYNAEEGNPLVRPALWIIILAGIGLRLWLYFQNWSMWGDEVMLSVSIVERNLSGLLQDLEYGQKAPLGFLVSEKLMTYLFGIQEKALRLFPLLCGISALVAFPYMTWPYLRSPGTLVAVGCLAFSFPVIYHASEAKQYSTELAATVWMFVGAAGLQRKPGVVRGVTTGVLGGLLLWLSYPLVFILCGLGLVLTITAWQGWQHGNRAALTGVAIALALWGASFLANYIFYINKGINANWLVQFWDVRDAFVPFPPTGKGDLVWYAKTTFQTLRYPLGLNWQFTGSKMLQISVVGLALLGIGVVSLVRKQRVDSLALLIPIVAALAASSLKLYPFAERLLVFLAPVLFVIIGRGGEACYHRAGRYRGIATAGLAFFLLSPLLNTIWMMTTTDEVFYKKNESRSGILYIANNMRPADHLYVQWGLEPIYRYYRKFISINGNNIVMGKKFRVEVASYDEFVDKQKKDLDTLAGKKRAWLLMSPNTIIHSKYLNNNAGFRSGVSTDRELILQIADGMGTRVDAYQRLGVALYLYDFSVRR